MGVAVVVVFAVLIGLVAVVFWLQRRAPTVWSRFAEAHELSWCSSPPTAGVISGEWKGTPIRVSQESAIGSELTRGPAIFRVAVVPAVPEGLVITPARVGYDAYHRGASRVPSGDATFDGAFGVYGERGENMARILTPEVRSALLAYIEHHERIVLFRGDLIITQSLPPINPRVLSEVLDRMTVLARVLGAAVSAEVVRGEGFGEAESS